VVNWSLIEDGVTPRGNAYQRARLPLLTTHIPKKADSGKFLLDSPLYSGEFKLLESGDELTVEQYDSLFESTTTRISSLENLFVEDGGFIAHASHRVGIRVISGSPALTLVLRALLVSF